MDKIEFWRNQQESELEQKHRRLIQDAKATRTRVEINRQQVEVDQQRQKAVKVTQEKQDASVRQTEANSMLATAESTGLRQKEETTAVVRAREKKERIVIEQECKSAIFAAEARFKAAQAKCDAVLSDAGAEQSAAAKLKVMREHELRMAKMEVLQAMAANNKIVISGDQGDKLINELMDSSILGSMSLTSR